jgi:hypothetical protein
MKQKRLFLEADSAIHDVLNSLSPEQLDLPVPPEWSTLPSPTLRDILAAHTQDEAWVPDMLAGKTIEESRDAWTGDLLGDDPFGSYNHYYDIATDAVAGDIPPAAVAHMSYGDYPVEEYLEHISYYRAFQAWSIARHFGIDYHLTEFVVTTLWQMLDKDLETFQSIGVFGESIVLPDDAPLEEKLLARVGYWVPPNA